MVQTKKEESLKDDRNQVYEIGYLLVSSIPEDKVADESASLKEILSKKEAEIISEESPELRTLAYTMSKKIGPSNHKFDQGYFGWFKFDVSVREIEGIKKSFEENPRMLRMLLINTVRENTYLGKKLPIASLSKNEEAPAPEALAEVSAEKAVQASIEEMDKSIDAMVKEA